MIFLEMSGVKIGARVTVPSKNVGVGTIAFIGETKFAKGEWIGLILDEKKGKNNGSIQGYYSHPPIVPMTLMRLSASDR